MLTDQHKEIILATVPLLRESGVALTKHFYNRMFTHHPELKNLFNMGNQNSGKQQTALAMAVLAYAENIANPVVLMPVVDMIGHKHTSLEEAGNWLGWRTFIVKSKVEESAEITSFYLKPKDGKALPKHLAGQYLSIKIFLPEMNLEQIRQYSISCAPNDEYFRISVKREKGTNIAVNGMISNYLHDYIFEGDELELSAPTGNFVLQETKNKKIFISGGIGQTPLLSMLETFDLNEKVQHDVVWIHACRNKEVHAFADKIKLIQNNHPNVSKYQFYDYIEESIADSSVLKGHIDFKKIEDWKFDKDSEYYVCGPRPFIKKMIEELEINQVNKEQIFFEEFGPKSL